MNEFREFIWLCFTLRFETVHISRWLDQNTSEGFVERHEPLVQGHKFAETIWDWLKDKEVQSHWPLSLRVLVKAPLRMLTWCREDPNNLKFSITPKASTHRSRDYYETKGLKGRITEFVKEASCVNYPPSKVKWWCHHTWYYELTKQLSPVTRCANVRYLAHAQDQILLLDID
jgi:hypothetical protein